jgi:hypothetical protein
VFIISPLALGGVAMSTDGGMPRLMSSYSIGGVV